MMTQGPTTPLAQEHEEEQEVTYVPDLYCSNPKCEQEIQLDSYTYAWYNGELGCPHCRCTLIVKIGDWEEIPYTGGRLPRTVPFSNSRGGRLLESPTLVREANFVPLGMDEGIGENVPADIRKAFKEAMDAYNERYLTGSDFGAVAERCRYALEAALIERGVSKGLLREMADRASEQGIITDDVVRNICLVVARRGGDGAHPQVNNARRITLANALTVIGETVDVLRHLYPPVTSP